MSETQFDLAYRRTCEGLSSAQIALVDGMAATSPPRDIEALIQLQMTTIVYLLAQLKIAVDDPKGFREWAEGEADTTETSKVTRATKPAGTANALEHTIAMAEAHGRDLRSVIESGVVQSQPGELEQKAQLQVNLSGLMARLLRLALYDRAIFDAMAAEPFDDNEPAATPKPTARPPLRLVEKDEPPDDAGPDAACGRQDAPGRAAGVWRLSAGNGRRRPTGLRTAAMGMWRSPPA